MQLINDLSAKKMKIERNIFLIVLFVVLVSTNNIIAQSYLFVNASVHTPEGLLENTDVLVENGLIKEIGVDLKNENNSPLIDLANKHLYPGFINAFSQLGINEVGAIWQTNDLGENDKFNPNINAYNAINMESPYISAARSNGILMNVTSPSKGTIPGKTTLIKTSAWNWEEANVIKDLSMLINYSGSLNSWRSFALSAETHLRTVDEIEGFLKEAYAYYSSVKSSKLYKKSPVYEAMIPVFDKELPVWVVANSKIEIHSAITFLRKYGVKVVIIGGDESYQVAEQLVENNIPVVLTNIFSVPNRGSEGFDAYFKVAAELYKKGVKFAIAVKGNMNTRNLIFNAAKAVSYGLPVDEAIKAISQYPAEIIGINNEYGSIEIGKKANLIVTSGNPLEFNSPIEKAFIDGVEIELSDKHKELRNKYKERYEE